MSTAEEQLLDLVLEVMTALGQMTHHRAVEGSMVMNVEQRARLLEKGWQLLSERTKNES